MKTYKIIRTIIYIALGVLTFIFNEQLVQEEQYVLNYLVGGAMLLFSFETVIILLVSKEFKHQTLKFVTQLLTLILGIILLTAINGNPEQVTITCVVWAVWGILREAEEICDNVIENFKTSKIVSILNLIESLILIGFSIALLIEPGAHHARTHVILLGIELILAVIWPHLNVLESKIITKRKEKKQNEGK